MQITGTVEHKVVNFESWGELLHFAETRETKCKNLSSREHTSDDGWYGTSTFNKAIDLAQHGWPEGTERVAKLAATIADKITSLVERDITFMDTNGCAFDIGLVNMGVPECWANSYPVLQFGHGRKVLRCVFNVSALADVNEQTMIRKGATAAVLIQALEYSGFRCEVTLASGVEDTCGAACKEIDTYTIIKPADQSLDIDRLVFALANPASHRRINFSVREGFWDFMECNQYGYGKSKDVADKGDIYIQRSHGYEEQWASEANCVKWILEELKKQGVKISS